MEYTMEDRKIKEISYQKLGNIVKQTSDTIFDELR